MNIRFVSLLLETDSAASEGHALLKGKHFWNQVIQVNRYGMDAPRLGKLEVIFS